MAGMNNEDISPLKVPKPEAGGVSEVRVPLSGGHPLLLVLGFDPADALCELSENDLSFKFEDGSEIILRGCFNPEQGLFPDFALEDGSELDGVELYAVLSGSIKLYPSASGPEFAPVLELSAPDSLFEADGSAACQSVAERVAFAGEPAGSFQFGDGDLDRIIDALLKSNGIL